MKGFITFLIFAAAVYGGYDWWNQRISFGVGASSPMGQYEKYEDYLTEKGLRPGTADHEDLDELFGSRVSRRSDVTATTFTGAAGVVTLVRNRSDTMFAVGAKFLSDQKTAPDKGSEIEVFMWLLWQDVTGAGPPFAHPTEDDEVWDPDVVLRAEATADRVACRWDKDATLGPRKVKDSATFVRSRRPFRSKARPSDTGD